MEEDTAGIKYIILAIQVMFHSKNRNAFNVLVYVESSTIILCSFVPQGK